MGKKTSLYIRQRVDHECSICGTGASLYRSTGSCRECFDNGKRYIPNIVLSAILDSIENINGLHRQALEYGRSVREYYRQERLKCGVAEPSYECPHCKALKPLFEFTSKWGIGYSLCYDCLYEIEYNEIEYTKRCSQCKGITEDYIEITDGLGAKKEWWCRECWDGYKKEKARKQKQGEEKRRNEMIARKCKKLLRKHDIDCADGNMMDLATCLVVGRESLVELKKYKKEIKERKKYESNYANVYGKQFTNEADYGGRRGQDGADCVCSTGV